MTFMSDGGVEILKSKFVSLLGRDLFNDLKENWYEKAVSSGSRYVVFVVRRSYILASIFELISDKKMINSGVTTFLTDSSIVRYCDEIADFYKAHGYFPKILLCDDILIHGRNVNSVIDKIEKRLIEILDGPEEEIKNDLSSAINIHIFVTNNAPLSLLSRYLPILVTKRIEGPAFWHKLSSDVSAYVNYTGIANAVYIFNKVISSKDYKQIKEKFGEEIQETVYQNVAENGYVHLYESGKGLVKWATTIRFIHFSKEEYNAIPFVYLPELDREESKLLIDDVTRRVNSHEYYKDARKLVEAMVDTKDSRGINELLTYILSCTVMKDFCGNLLYQSKLFDDGCVYRKLARHLGVSKLSEQKIEKALEQLSVCPLYDTSDDIDDFLQAECLGIDRYLLQYDFGSKDVTEEDIKLSLENYFYVNGRESEYRVYTNRKVQRIFDSYTPSEVSKNLNSTIENLCKNYNKKNVEMAFRYMMQLMDAGVFAVSGNYHGDKGYIGYHESAKAGEQALLLLALRNDLFVPLITRIYDYCKLRRIELDKHIEDFFDSVYGQEIIADAQRRYNETIDAFRVINFIDNLEYMGQEPGDWNGNYTIRLPYFKNASISDVMNYNDQKSRYVKMYDSYCVETRE